MVYRLYKENDLYPRAIITKRREAVRGICVRDDYKIALHVMKRDDIFGKAVYHELPGGGVDSGENEEKALEREIREELGWRGTTIRLLSEVWDFYTPIRQENHTMYYLFRLKEPLGERNLQSIGDLLIEKTVFVTPQEAIELYKNQEDSPIGNLVRERELHLLEALVAADRFGL